MKIGAQLYTVRDNCKTLPEFSETLKRVADIGYTEVQVSGVCDFEPEWLKDELKRNGLVCAVTHTNPQKIKNETQAVIEAHRIFNCRYIGIGCAPNMMHNGMSDFNALLEILNSAKEQVASADMLLMFHNHHVEFDRVFPDGETYFDRLLSLYKPNELGFTLDTYWLQYAGMDVRETLKALKGRIPCVHFKDMTIVGREQRMAPVGCGNLRFDLIIGECVAAGTEHILVEQDNCYGDDPFECLKKSYDYLISEGLE